MKTTLITTCISATLLLSACGTSTENTTTTEGQSTEAAAQIPTLAINEAEWEDRTLSPLPLTVKLPKDAKVESNGNGGVDIRISDFYVLSVNQPAYSSVSEALESEKILTVNHSSMQNGKMLVQDQDGYVYTVQMKDEANGLKYQAEAHFVLYLQKTPDDALISIQDIRPLDNFMVPGSAYSEDIAKKVYSIIKSSAKLS